MHLKVMYDDNEPKIRTIFEALKSMDMNLNWCIEYYKLHATGEPIAEMKPEKVDAKLLGVPSQWVWVMADVLEPPPKKKKKEKKKKPGPGPAPDQAQAGSSPGPGLPILPLSPEATRCTVLLVFKGRE